jgi:membrane protein YqaA with SNARE-associated domain
MRLFAPIYERTLALASHPRAPSILVVLSAAESIFFPVPPDVMLAPMTLAQPRRGLYYATICTAASVIGGLIGYMLGAFAFELISPLLHRFGYWDHFAHAQELFAKWGFWIVVLAGFSPIPYKVFTIASGVLGMALLPFVLGSIVGRGGRFFLVAGLIMWGGARMESTLRRHVELLGLAVGRICDRRDRLGTVGLILAWGTFGVPPRQR